MAIIVAVAVVVLIGLAYGFWESNLKPLANVNGTQIGRGEWEDRQRLDAFRADRTETATRAALLAGEIDEDLANTRLTAATNARNAGAAGAMETLVDLHLKKQLAEEQGVTLSEEELAAALAADGTLPEARRIAALVVQPLGSSTGQATAEDTAAARAKADEALAALKSGTPIADLVDEYSPATAAQDGDIGFRTLDDLRAIDPAWAESLFALDEGGITEVVDSPLGFLIGVVSDIVPEAPDAGFLAAVNEKVGEAVHRRNVELEALAAKLEDKISADAVAKDYDQVRLAEILVAGDTLVAPEDDQPSVRASHILYRPEPSDATASPAPDASADPGATRRPAPVASPAAGASPAPGRSLPGHAGLPGRVPGADGLARPGCLPHAHPLGRSLLGRRPG